MKKIFSLDQTTQLNKNLQKQEKRIVLVGGCFDILHHGHLFFLQEAKKQGDILVVLLESDEKTKTLKGKNRPQNTQEKRAYALEKIRDVDYIYLLPPFMDNDAYDQLVLELKPAIIASTRGDPSLIHKKRQAKMIESQVVEIKKIPGISTTQLLKDQKNI